MHIPARKRFLILAVVVLSPIVAGCGPSDVPGDSGCRNLEYKEDGLSRSEYLPCAGEIVAALDELSVHSKAAAQGDSQARSAGRAALSRVNALMTAAGGRNLLERWRDRGLTEFNVRMNNAVTHYEAFYMVRVLEEPNQFAAQSRDAAAAELRAAQRSHDEARSTYRRLQ